MQEININVRVQLGLTDNLFSVLSAIAGRCATPGAVAQPAPVEKVINKEAPAVEATTAEPEAPAVEAVEAATAEPEAPAVAAATEEPAEAEKEYTVVDVRAAMDRTRRRIEGEDYKENTDSAGYKKWHRALNAWFKNTAAVYGSEKPSALSDSKSCEGFINDCDALTVKNDELFTEVPF